MYLFNVSQGVNTPMFCYEANTTFLSLAVMELNSDSIVTELFIS